MGKTERVLVCNSGNNIRTRTHVKGNRAIEQADEFAYLGSTISEDSRSKREMIKRICQVKMAFNRKGALFTSINITAYTSEKIVRMEYYNAVRQRHVDNC